MKNFALLICIVVTIFFFENCFATTNTNISTSGYTSVLKFVTSYFVEGDIEKSMNFISPLASFRERKPGSVIKELEGSSDFFKKIRVKEIIFFTQDSLTKDIIKLNKNYNIRKNGWINEYPNYMDNFFSINSIGCLLIVEKKNGTETLILSFIFDKVDEGYKITHMDDPI